MKNKNTKKVIAFLVVVVLVMGSYMMTALAEFPSLSASKYIKSFTISQNNNTPAYKTANTSTRIGTIYATDELYIYSISGSWVYCSYPVASGRKYAYIPLSTITANNMTHVSSTARAQITTYKRSSTANSYGYVSKGDRVTSVAKNGNYIQIVYPISGGYKLGWITLANYNSFVKPTASVVIPTPVVKPKYVAPVKTVKKFSSWKESGFHHDIPVGKGTAVYAICDGTVTYKQAYRTDSVGKYLSSYGKYIDFTSTDGKTTAVYAHLNKFTFSYSGEITRSKTVSGSAGTTTIKSVKVKQGDLIGYSGTTGNSSGPHLHFELRINGTRVDPCSYVGMSH